MAKLKVVSVACSLTTTTQPLQALYQELALQWKKNSKNMIEKAKHANIVVFYIVGDIIWSAQPIQVSAQGNNGNHSISIRLVLSPLFSIYKQMV